MLKMRIAAREDLTRIIELLSDDKLAAKRESSSANDISQYVEAFEAISNDKNNELVVACIEDKIIGTLQLTYIPNITRMGSWRCQIEGVRIDKSHRGKGYGELLFQWVIDRAKMKKCRLLQLTSDKERPEAIQFYEKIGFLPSHEGLKMKL